MADQDETIRPLITRQGVLEADDTKYGYVDVPEWGGRARIRSLTAGEREAYEQSTFAREQLPDGTWERTQNLVGLRAKLIVKALIDEAGRPVFRDEDARALAKKNTAVVHRVYEAVQRLSGMRADDRAAAGEASDSDQSAASSSGSPDTSGAPSPNSGDA